MKFRVRGAEAKELIVKAQIHAGGRGKGHFDNGYKGGVQICETYASLHACLPAATRAHYLVASGPRK